MMRSFHSVGVQKSGHAFTLSMISLSWRSWMFQFAQLREFELSADGPKTLLAECILRMRLQEA
jgi:hypothetical protein